MIRRPPRSTQSRSSAASDVYKRQEVHRRRPGTRGDHHPAAEHRARRGGVGLAGRLPALFIGHGSPMNIVADNGYTRDLEALAAHLPRPAAILVVSAPTAVPC